MKTNDEVRRFNLIAAIKKAGSATKLADQAQTAAAYLSQIKTGAPDSKTGKPKTMGDELARRIEAAIGEASGWMDTDHTAEQPHQDPDSPFIDAPGHHGGMGVRVGADAQTVPIRAVKLRLQAGVSDFVVEPDYDVDHGYFQVPKRVIDGLRLNPADLIVMAVKGRSMEPYMFEDERLLVDTSKRTPVANECFAINWNGEPIVKRLIKKGDNWCLYSMNPDPQYHTIDVRSGQCSIVGMVVWQPDRVMKGLL